MTGKRVKIFAEDIVQGMFVAQLDRPWLETPFLLQGFEVREPAEIDQLRHYCEHVYVDPKRSTVAEKDVRQRSLNRSRVRLAFDGSAAGQRPTSPGLLRRVGELLARIDPTGSISQRLGGLHQYENTVSTRREARRAARAYTDAVNVMNEVLDQLRDGCTINLPRVRAASAPLIDSILRNPDAMSWYVTLQKQNEYNCHHSVACAVWAVVLGRHLGFDRASLDKLALGGMLLDVGKTRVPLEVLNKSGELSRYEIELLCQHVDFGVDMAKRSRGVDRDVLDMIECHHERYDGSGYPRGLAGADIPVYGRIGGIVDCYDAMVTQRAYAPATSAYDAVCELNNEAGGLFQRELVEQFVQALGMFPTGSLVELNTGEVGFVTEQNRVRRLRPKVMVLLDADKQPMRRSISRDLGRLPSSTASPRGIWITQGHEPAEFGLNPTEFFLPRSESE